VAYFDALMHVDAELNDDSEKKVNAQPPTEEQVGPH
jgi:hypothetical protein